MASNYPMGAEHDPNAPWNQCDPKPIERDVVAVFSLSTCKTTETTNYYCEGDKYEGYFEVLDDVDWSEEFKNQHYSPLELIDMYKKELEEKKKSMTNLYEIHKIEHIISECENWDEELDECYKD
jgi:hypothetical protein